MSPVLSNDNAFFDAVQDYFVQRTGRGIILSSRDLELLMGWFRAGAPATTVCQGIDEAVEALGRAPRDLHACRKFVQERVDRLGVVRVGISRSPRLSQTQPPAPNAPSRADGDEEPVVIAQLRAVQQTSRPELRSVFAHLYAHAAELIASGRDPVEVGFAVEDRMVDEVYAALPSDDRLTIDAQIDQRYGSHLQRMTDEGREETVRACRRDILAARYGLPQLVA